MLSDHVYDLMTQLVEESQSLWRIKNTYKTDSVGCEKCLKFWEKMEKDKQAHIDELTELLKSHLK
jgi:multimeric flavodoxin WrbA